MAISARLPWRGQFLVFIRFPVEPAASWWPNSAMLPTFPSIARRFSLFLVLVALQPGFARAAAPTADADDDDRTVLASQVLELAYSPNTLRDSFSGFLTPALEAMKREGMPVAAQEEMRKAFTEWFDQEVKWTDIKPKLIKIYSHDFTVEELRALLGFLQKPLGQKVMAKLPLVMQDGAFAGQQYFKSKEDSLNAKLAPIFEKYQGKPAK